MRVMGLDYGDKTIGVAVSDELGWTAQGLKVIRRRNPSDDFEQLQQIIDQYQIREIVVGLPKNMDGSIGSRGNVCIQFAEQLKSSFQLPIHLWDERLTTISAQRTLIEADVSRKKRKQVVDKLAAAIILQGYIDSKKIEGEGTK